jgi:hypothetical protein
MYCLTGMTKWQNSISVVCPKHLHGNITSWAESLTEQEHCVFKCVSYFPPHIASRTTNLQIVVEQSTSVCNNDNMKHILNITLHLTLQYILELCTVFELWPTTNLLSGFTLDIFRNFKRILKHFLQNILQEDILCETRLHSNNFERRLYTYVYIQVRTEYLSAAMNAITFLFVSSQYTL